MKMDKTQTFLIGMFAGEIWATIVYFLMHTKFGG
jgi:hypothetical protein